MSRRPASVFCASAASGLLALVALGPITAAAQDSDSQDNGIRAGVQCDDPAMRGTRALDGDVRDLLTEQPMPGVVVHIRATQFVERTRTLAITMTDTGGGFRFCGVPRVPGVELQAEAEFFKSHSLSLAEDRSGSLGTLYIEWSVPIDVVGQVLDVNTGEPIEGAVVSVDGRGARSTTGSEGRFRIAGQGAGSVRLTTRAVGYASRTDTMSTTSGDQLDVQILMGAEAVQLAPLLVRARSAVEFEELTAGSRFDILTVEEIDTMLPRIMGFNSLLRNAQFPGITISERAGGTVCVQAHRGGPSTTDGCNMVEVFLDGLRLHAAEEVLSSLDPAIVQTMQYLDPIEASVRFTGPRVSNGVLVIETRRGTRRPR